MIELRDARERRALLPFYADTQDTLLLSGLQGHLGRGFLSDNGQSALLMVQGFVFLSGKADGDFLAQAMAACDPGCFLTFSGSDDWLLQAEKWGADIPMTRYRLETPAVFDVIRLQQLAAEPAGFQVVAADEPLYRACLSLPWARDCVSAFSGYEHFRERGLAVMAIQQGAIVAACGAYAFSDGQWEVEIDTHPAFRRRGLATACGAKFVLCCLERGVKPHWDAMTSISMTLARKLGFSHPQAYRVQCREGNELYEEI